MKAEQLFREFALKWGPSTGVSTDYALQQFKGFTRDLGELVEAVRLETRAETREVSSGRD